MQPTYELVALLHPDLEIDIEAPIAKLEGLVTDLGGRIVKRDNWGKKRLAYRINKQDFAIYLYLELEIAGESIRELERQLLITEEVLRHIIVVHEVNPARPERTEKREVKSGQEL